MRRNSRVTRSFEADDAVLTYDSYERACNYFNNLENLADFSHIPYAHAGMMGTWDEHADGPVITATESVWGVSARATRPSGKEILTQFGMPNIGHVQALPDGSAGALPRIPFMVGAGRGRPAHPVHHRQKQARAGRHRRLPRAPRRTLGKTRCGTASKLARDILAGRKRYDEVDTERVNMVFLSDDLAQMGRRHAERAAAGAAGTRRRPRRAATPLMDPRTEKN
jgi:hypothetical protein